MNGNQTVNRLPAKTPGHFDTPYKQTVGKVGKVDAKHYL